MDSRFNGVNKSLQFLRDILKKEDLTLAEFSLLFVAGRKEITKVVIGVENLVQLKEHCKTLKKNVDPKIFSEALELDFDDESILNPSFLEFKAFDKRNRALWACSLSLCLMVWLGASSFGLRVDG